MVGSQEVELPGGFDAFRDDLEVEAVAHLDGLAHHGAVGFAGLQVMDEGAVDLELVSGDIAELAHHGEAGSEVVDGELDLFEAEAGEDIEGAGELFDESALGDLEDDSVGRNAVLAGEREEDIGIVEVAQGVGGDVEREGGKDALVVGELRELGEGLVGDEPAELVDEAERLEAGDEVIGRDDAVTGVTPPGQGFEADDCPGGDVDLGLEVDDELVVFDRVSEIVIRRGDGLDGEGDGQFGPGVGAEQAFELAQTEGLVQVADDGETVHAAKLLRSLDDALADAAHEDDGGAALLLAQESEELDSVDVGHEQIDENEGGVGVDGGEEDGGIGGGLALEAHGVGGAGDDLSNVVVIVDDEDLLRGGHWGLLMEEAGCELETRRGCAELGEWADISTSCIAWSRFFRGMAACGEGLSQSGTVSLRCGKGTLFK
jgi:hypothetical protein